jgi:hypothetical protein
MASRLPFDGSTVHVRHKYKSGVQWKSVDYQYTALDDAPEMTSPIDGGTLNHSTITFDWKSDIITVEKYRLYVGKKLGENNLYDSGALSGDVAPHSMSHTVHQLPIDGRQLYVRLRFKVNGVWYKKDYQYTAVTWNFAITSPEVGSKLPDDDETFDWAANGAPVDEWKLTVGSSEGTSDIYSSGWQPAGTTAAFVSGIPTDGRKIYARLKTRFYYDVENYDVHYRDYEYKTNFVSHRIFNSLVCGGSKFTVKATISGKSASSVSGKWSSCVKTKPGRRKAKIYANAGVCGIIDESAYYTSQLGCHYDWVIDLQGSQIDVWRIETCPGTCSTPKPWPNQSLADPAAAPADSIELIMRIPVEGDFKTLE